MKNKHAQTLGLAILSALAVFICGFVFLNFLFEPINTFRADMSCASPATISSGVKILCLVTDGVVPFFILGILSLAVGAVTARLSLG